MPDWVEGHPLQTHAAVPNDVNLIPESVGFASHQLSQPGLSPFAPQLVPLHHTAAHLQLGFPVPAFCKPCNDFSLPPHPILHSSLAGKAAWEARLHERLRYES